jgi:hypothetical protein
MKQIIGILVICLLGYYGVRYYNHMNSGHVEVSSPLVPIVNEWKSAMYTRHLPIKPFNRIRKIIIVNDSVVDGDAGYCSKYDQVIYISKSTIKKGYWSTKAAVWHELGHFIFELDHVDGLDIMNAYTFSEEEYKDNWPKLEKNYYKQCKEKEYVGRY